MALYDERDENLLKRHQERKPVDWIPYHARRSTGQFTVTDTNSDSCHQTTALMEVAGLGWLVLRATARYDFERNEYVWDQNVEMTGCLHDVQVPG
jgi:hypothetical protein